MKEKFTEQELDLRELYNILWKGKWLIVLFTTLFTICAVFYAISQPNIYRADALLAPNSQSQTGSGINSVVNQLGGLASLAGIKSSGNSTDKVAYALEILKSREFVYDFIKNHELKAILLATAGWDKNKNELIYNKELYDSATKSWSVSDAGISNEPSMQKAYDYFINSSITIFRNEDNGFVEVSFSHFSPYLTKSLLDSLILSLNKKIKQQDLTEATKSLSYFKSELNETNVTGLKNMFYQLIEEQYRTIMLTKVRPDYVFKVVDRAVIPEEKSEPKRALISIFGFLAGLVFSFMFVLINALNQK